MLCCVVLVIVGMGRTCVYVHYVRKDVLRTSGQFYLKYQPSNSEIETTLPMQANNDRDFMTIPKDGGFIHAERIDIVD